MNFEHNQLVSRGRVDARLDALLSNIDERLERCEITRGLAGERAVLLNLWVAASQLREADEIGRARAAILDIVISLIGCEQVGLFEVARSGTHEQFELACSLGLSDERKRDLIPDLGWIGERVASGRAFVSGTGPLQLSGTDAHGLSACLPLSDGERTIAVLVLYGLVGNKRRLSALDHHLLALLYVHAGSVLMAARRRDLRCGWEESSLWSLA